MSVEEEEKRGWSIALWADGSSKFDLEFVLFVGVSSIATRDCLYLWLYTDGIFMYYAPPMRRLRRSYHMH